MFRVCSGINKFHHIYASYCNPGQDGSLHDCLLDSMTRVQPVDDNKAFFVFVGEADANNS